MSMIPGLYFADILKGASNVTNFSPSTNFFILFHSFVGVQNENMVERRRKSLFPQISF